MASLVVLAVTIALLGSTLAEPHRLIVSDIALLGAGVATIVSCRYRMRRSVGRRRRAWGLFTAAGASAVVGNTWILAVHLFSGSNRLVNVSAPTFYLATVLGVAGMASFPAVARRGTDLARMILDGVIIALALFTIANLTVFTQLLDNKALSLPLAAGDVVVACLAALLFLRVGQSDRVVLALVGAGCACYALTDLTTAAITYDGGSYSYATVNDAGWLAGYLLIVLAAQHPANAAAETSAPPREASATAGTVLVFALLGMAAVLSTTGIRTSGFTRGSAVLWLLLLLAVAARQVLLILDNDRLRRDLERRVDERTDELRHATLRSELLLTSVGEGIYGVDRAGLVTFVNPAGARTLGLTPNELIGSEAHSTFHAVQADGTPFPVESCYITEAITMGLVTLTEGDAYSRADGSTFPVEVTATPLARDGVVQGAVMVFRDVTQRHEMDRLKSEFVSMVSHELRTPLTSIRGSLGLLAGGALGPLPSAAVRMVGLALDSSARLTRLINDILDVERIESGTMPMEIGDHRAAALIEAATSQLHVLAAEVDVSLVVTKTEGTVRADADRVVQTLINLVDNAIKFSPGGSTIEVGSTVSDHLVHFEIRDQGRGIPADKLDRIFGRFEQVDSSDAREKGGSGLGLAISRSVIERLGGEIWAESTEGVGSSFHFTLPQPGSGPELSAGQADGTNDPPTTFGPVLAGPHDHSQRATAGLT